MYPPRRDGNLHLTELMDGAYAFSPATHDVDLDIRGLAADSRAVEPGFLFAALAGSRLDGRRFIDDAIARGATALLVETEAAADLTLSAPGVRVVEESHPRGSLALMAEKFFSPPHSFAICIQRCGMPSDCLS